MINVCFCLTPMNLLFSPQRTNINGLWQTNILCHMWQSFFHFILLFKITVMNVDGAFLRFIMNIARVCLFGRYRVLWKLRNVYFCHVFLYSTSKALFINSKHIHVQVGKPNNTTEILSQNYEAVIS